MNSLEKIEQFAKDNYIPIARKQTIEFIVNTIKKNNYLSFLEIGKKSLIILIHFHKTLHLIISQKMI